MSPQINWLTLMLTHGLGFKTFQKLENTFKNVENICHASTQALKQLSLPNHVIQQIKHPNQSNLQKHLAWIDSSTNHHLVTYDDPSYPDLLKQISNPPIALMACGQLDLLHSPQLAIVGCRHPTPFARRTTQKIGSQLSQYGLSITSGLAMGIDTEAHTAALQTTGNTIAVIGTGIDCYYPHKNKSLAQQIMKTGLIISEFPLGTAPKPCNFPRRNRIISGLSQGVWVAEAALKSGSLITARYANEQGRDVFATPSTIENTHAKGCHQLIKSGAQLVESAEDIIQSLNCFTGMSDTNNNTSTRTQTPSAHHSAPPKLTKLFDHITMTAITLDEIAVNSNLTIHEITSGLLELEMLALIKNTPDGYCRT